MLARFYKILKPILFLFNPELAHAIALMIFKVKQKLFFRYKISEKYNILQQKIWNTVIKNPFLMAAGFDKTAEMFLELNRFGFSVVELGTVTPKAQKGNDKPRVWRFIKEKSIVNRMGFNNPGIEKCLENIFNLLRKNDKARFAISIGKQKETEPQEAYKDYEIQIKQIEKHKDIRKQCVYIALNISSPNTPGLRHLQQKKYIVKIIKKCKENTSIPILVKFAPDFENIKDFKKSVNYAVKAGCDGIIVTNTTSNLSKYSFIPQKIIIKGGGLSGEPMKELSEKYLTAAREAAGEKITIISSGGVMSPLDIWKRLLLGASLVQIYTGFIYEGPQLLKNANALLQQKLKEYNIKSLVELKKYREKIFLSEKKQGVFK
ncbi:MAG: quinone-dependent dihydroorotate dehydrogenase [Spirochaetia bacterium]|nr:quinone-dependent dihydroorotate dehydrogenase [Spirochaetia bacterium]